MNYTSALPQQVVPTQRSTSFFIEDILLHKPKPLRDVFHSPFAGSLAASRMPLLEYGYPLMPTPILAPHPHHHALHKPVHEHHHQYFFTSASPRAAGQALQAEEGAHRVLRLAAVRPGEEVRDPEVPVHAREGGAGHGAQPLGNTGENVVPEPAHEAQEAAEEGAGRPEALERHRPALHGDVERERDQ
ncbi:hypothetical protein NHX12_009953 [Muraenolepis orangiensis]|uniref:Uncharacterized protein n=1 Tax=Muraenolepis orangiensis TaxID=630683 RepID=A0A9Q0I8E9_9TELE|nr:hypothetical protein NHX12_009953 [Muraenolepis orangiensis]